MVSIIRLGRLRLLGFAVEIVQKILDFYVLSTIGGLIDICPEMVKMGILDFEIFFWPKL